ncbi:unnamed protein product [Ceutorhynchus assimilis]|uniref:Uncharacterized protein n=1 Tax=Ceutorhynchus assimilis TaxID=467358 RepID=A0A9N9QQJ3_9CUCU|nr:unnamed protein product [Ceutorhynchus assimilis]
MTTKQNNTKHSKYPTPENRPFVVSPKLNAEIRAALNEAGRKRDERLVACQKEVGIALTAVARAQSILLNRPYKDEETLSLIEHLGDTSLLFSLNSNNFKPELREALAEVPLDTYLIGEDLGERIKTAKSFGKSVADLKAGSSKAKYAPQTLKAHNPNSLSPLRQKKYKHQRRSWQNRNLEGMSQGQEVPSEEVQQAASVAAFGSKGTNLFTKRKNEYDTGG